jgi:predicted DNA-binding protein (MmcQ/YjbR family)
MTLTDIRNYCSAKKGSREDFPFDFEILAIRAGSKIYLLTSVEKRPLAINLKCDPERAVALRKKYKPLVTEGYHMNKKHWNTVIIDGTIPDIVIYEMIDHSYDLVYNSLTKKEQSEIK